MGDHYGYGAWWFTLTNKTRKKKYKSVLHNSHISISSLIDTCFTVTFVVETDKRWWHTPSERMGLQNVYKTSSIVCGGKLFRTPRRDNLFSPAACHVGATRTENQIPTHQIMGSQLLQDWWWWLPLCSLASSLYSTCLCLCVCVFEHVVAACLYVCVCAFYKLVWVISRWECVLQSKSTWMSEAVWWSSHTETSQYPA